MQSAIYILRRPEYNLAKCLALLYSNFTTLVADTRGIGVNYLNAACLDFMAVFQYNKSSLHCQIPIKYHHQSVTLLSSPKFQIHLWLKRKKKIANFEIMYSG